MIRPDIGHIESESTNRMKYLREGYPISLEAACSPHKILLLIEYIKYLESENKKLVEKAWKYDDLCK